MLLIKYYHRHLQAKKVDELRLGQRFCNDFIANSWPQLYYQEDDQKSLICIEKFLRNNHYFPNMPDVRQVNDPRGRVIGVTNACEMQGSLL